MKGVAIAIETVIYLILGVTVLSIALFFFLSQAGPAQDQYKLEADRNRFCGTYVSIDFQCKGGDTSSGVHASASPEVLAGIAKACGELARRQGFNYQCQGQQTANLQCIQSCCFTCPQYGKTPGTPAT
jgi:hypothetical protein